MISLFDFLQPDFMKTAFLALIVASLVFALLGTYIVNSSMAFFSDAIGHSALTGIALGLVLGLKEPKIAMVVFCLFLGFAIINVKLHSFESTDTIIGVFSSSAVALGLVILSCKGNFAGYQKYLVGDILTIQMQEVFMLFLCAVLLAIVWILFYNKMLLITVHSVFAKSRGVKTTLIQVIFALLTSGIVSSCICWTGLLLVNSLLVLPSAVSRLISKSCFSYSLISCIVSLTSSISGLILSYYFGFPASSAIVLLDALCFLCVFAGKSIAKRLLQMNIK